MMDNFLSSEMVLSAKRSVALLLTPPKWWAVASAAVGATFISLPQSYQLLISVMAASFLSGFFVALRRKQLCPWDGFNSVIRRVAELGFIYITHKVFDAFSNHFGVPMDLTPLVALMFTGIEFTSLIEDCQVLGVPVPVFVTSQMKRLQDAIGASAQVAIETQTTKLSPAGLVIGTEQSVTTLRPVDNAPLIVPATDVSKPATDK